MRDTIIQGDTLTVLKTLPDQLVDMIVTSPAYWGLRDYGVVGQLGLEPTIGEYISNMTAVFEEVRRVLKDTGTLWLNMGDAYCGSGGPGGDYKNGRKGMEYGTQYNHNPIGLKPKDLIGQPWRLAFALQAAGWYLRSDIIWHKPNPMPESVTDRPTKSHEYIFLLTKKAQYYYDAEAVREKHQDKNHPNGFSGKDGIGERKNNQGWSGGKVSLDKNREYNPAGRNKRTVWTIATQPYSEAHFATFPEKLVEPCIRAGTSERGNCAECGKPWVRVVEQSRTFESGSGKSGNMPIGKNGPNLQGGGETLDIRRGPIVHNKTLGWKPSCSCDTDKTVSPIVLDPFFGSGTVGLVAKKLNRDYIGIDLSPEYIKMAEKRIRGKMGLFVKEEQ